MRVGVAGFNQLFLAKDDGLFLGDETLHHRFVLSRIGCHRVLRELRHFIFFTASSGIEWLLQNRRNLIVFAVFRGFECLFRDRRYFMIFANLSGIERLTGRARVRGRAASANAMIVDMSVSKCFPESRFVFSFDSPFEQHVFQQLPFDRLGKVIILYKV